MWTWINLFEIFFALPLCLAMVPIQGIPVSGISENIRSGFHCLLEGGTFDKNHCENSTNKKRPILSVFSSLVVLGVHFVFGFR
jgi:hypothetical protein